MAAHDKMKEGSYKDSVYRYLSSDNRFSSLDTTTAALVKDGYSLAVIGKEKVRELLEGGETASLQSLSRPRVQSAVQLDLFGGDSIFYGATGGKADGQANEQVVLQQEDRSRDLTALRLRSLDEGEQCFVERRYRESGFFDFVGGEKIESALHNNVD